jgi:hypothetical protein
MSDAAKLQLGFDLDYGITHAFHRSMEKESNRPQLAEKTADSGAGLETSRPRSPRYRGLRSPKLLGVLV